MMSESIKASRIQNLKDAFSDGPTRLIYIGSIVLILVCVGVGYWVFVHNKGKASDPSRVTSFTGVAGAPSPVGQNGLPKATPQYDGFVADENAANANRALETGTSAIPTVRTGVQESVVEPEKKSVEVAQPTPTPEEMRRDAERYAAEQIAAQTRYDAERTKNDEAIKARKDAMKSQVNLLVTSWQPGAAKTYEIYASKEGVGSAPGAGSQNPDSGQNGPASPPLAKAGDLQCGQVDTAVNTDEPGPVLATIWQEGKLKKTKLLGKAENGQNGGKPTLHFTTANIPGVSGAQTVDAYAVDPFTSRTALATAVDNHYIERYGTFLASAFVEGYGSAVIQGGQNQQLVASPSGTVVQTDALNNKQIISAAFGNVGKKVGDNMANSINRPATYTVDSGTAVCILFMNDVQVKNNGGRG